MSKIDHNIMPVLPLRDIVVFPNIVVPLFVGRESSIKALEEVMKSNKKILLVTQKNSNDDLPKSDDLHKFGTISNILQLLKLPDGTLKVLVEGKSKVKIINYSEKNKYFEANYELVNNRIKSQQDCKVLKKLILKLFESYSNINKEITGEILTNIISIKEV